MPKKQTVSEALTSADIEGRFAVIVKIRPELPQDRMVKAQLAQAFRTPGADGRPLMDDLTVLEEIVEAEHPDTIRRRIDAQALPAQSPDIQKLLTAAREQQWIEDHPETVALAEKKLGAPVPQETVMAMMQLLMKQMQGAQGLPQLMAQADTMAAGGQPMGAPGQGPVGMDPSALPSQMQIGADPGAQNQQDLALLAASQAQRGRAQSPF